MVAAENKGQWERLEFGRDDWDVTPIRDACVVKRVGEWGGGGCGLSLW